jgi:hypothetical protein
MIRCGVFQIPAVQFCIFGNLVGRRVVRPHLSHFSHRGLEIACVSLAVYVKSVFAAVQGKGLAETGLPPRSSLPQLPQGIVKANDSRLR